MTHSVSAEKAGALVLGSGSRGLLVIAASTIVAIALVAVGSIGIVLAAAIVLAGAAALLLTNDVRRGLLFLTFFLAPVDIGKALIASKNYFVPDAPGLYLSAMDIAAFGSAALWLWDRTVVQGRRLQYSSIDIAAVMFLAWIWIEALRSPAGMLALATAAAYTKYVVIFYFVSYAIRSASDWRTVVTASACIFAIAAPHVFAQALTHSPLPLPGAKLPDTASTLNLGSVGTAFRPMGFFNHPNALADYLVLFLPTAICITLLRRRVSQRAFITALAMSLAGIVMLVLTLTRGGWLALLLASLTCVALCWRFGALSSRQVFIGALIAVLVGTVVIASTPRLLARLTEPDSRSLESRSLLAGHAMEMIKDRPILGVGFGGYHRAAENYSAPGFATVSADYQKGLRQLVVHNHYLLLAVELGIPAVIGFMLLMLALLHDAVKWLGSNTDLGKFCLGVGLTSALVGNLLFLASDNYYADIRIGLLWLCAGLLRALILGDRDNEATGPERRTKVIT